VTSYINNSQNYRRPMNSRISRKIYDEILPKKSGGRLIPGS